MTVPVPVPVVLRPLQRAALRAIRDTAITHPPGGALLALSVGAGKTLVGLLAGTVAKARKPLYLAPSALLPQLERMRAQAVQDGFAVPQNLLIFPYSQLSMPKHSNFLQEYQPDLIYADECHTLKNPLSSRTKRVKRYLEDPDPASPGANCAFIGASGTLMNADPTEFLHLARWALPNTANLFPANYHHLQAWSRILGATGEPPEPADWALVTDLIRASDLPDGATLQQRARRGFAKRFAQTPGVVVSPENTVKASLRIHTLGPADGLWHDTALYKRVAETGTRPDGYVFEDDSQLWQCLNHISLGFYYKWRTEPPPEWSLARSDWARHLRAELAKHSRPGYDSPHLVEQAIIAQGTTLADSLTNGAHPLYGVWSTWDYIQQHTGYTPETIAVRCHPLPIPPWLENQACRGAPAQPTLFWYQSQEVGDALEEKFAPMGIPVYRAGQDIDTTTAHTCALSLRSHGKGLNLQAWSSMVFVEPSPSGQVFEQAVGRCHREGQQADTVTAYYYTHTPLYKRMFRDAQADARCIQEVLATPQKLCYADIVAGCGVVE